MYFFIVFPVQKIMFMAGGNRSFFAVLIHSAYVISISDIDHALFNPLKCIFYQKGI